MEDEAAVATESTSDEAASEDPTGSTPEGEGEGEPESGAGGEPAGEDDGEQAGEGSGEGHRAAGDDEDPEYKNLVAKFAHIINPRDRNAAIGRAWWEKTRYASQVRKENEALKLELARREGATPKQDEPEAPPPPDLAKAVAKIQNLYQRGQSLVAERQEVVNELNAKDRDLAVAEHVVKQTEENDERRPLAEARLRQARLELDTAKGRYRSILERQEALEDRMETAIAEKDFIERFHKDRQQRQKSEQERSQQFRTQFPEQVDGLVVAAAKHVNLKLDSERLQASLAKHVSRALHADISRQYMETEIEDIPVPEMVLEYVKEWAEERDLLKRQDFAKTSKEKLAVASRAAPPSDRKAPVAASKPVPAYQRAPVPPALLSRSSTPAMAKARRILTQLFDRKGA